METASTSTGWQKQRNPENIFNPIAPLSAPSSTPTNAVPYDVFINPCGPDVKSTLASCIYHTLDLMGFRAFLNSEELQSGDDLSEKIQSARQSASLHIAIFSENYAQSPWCLSELSFMLESGTKIIPVFYEVNPIDLRFLDRGIYADAFQQHERKGRYTTENIDEWKKALYKISYYDGYIFKKDVDDEGMLLKRIVKRVLKEIKKQPIKKQPTFVTAKHPVGLDETVQEFEGTLALSASEQNVQIVGIVGIGGSGKTTLAKEIYNRKSSSFERCSFLFDVRRAAAKNELHKKQQKLLEDLGVKDLALDSIEEGKEVLARRLRSGSELIVLDDVNRLDQVDALLPPVQNLGLGSLVIVTTREIGVLRLSGISRVYKMQGLNQSCSQQLFCWHAFLQPFPSSGFEDLVEKFVNACNGIPLAIINLGRMLYGRPRNYWESHFDNLTKKLFKNIKGSLKDLSHQSTNRAYLEEEPKFFESNPKFPKSRGATLEILESIQKFPKCIGQLQHLEKIVVDGFPNTNLEALPDEFCQLQSLRHLTLRWCMSLSSLPKEFGNLTRLQHLDLAFCNQLKELPQSFKQLIQLRYLDLQGCSNLRIPPCFLGRITALQDLNFQDCKRLSVLPAQIPFQVSLRSLNLLGTELEDLPNEVGRLTSLEVLQIGSPYLTDLPVSLANMRNLKTLNIEGCTNLKCLPKSLRLLEHLSIKATPALKEALQINGETEDKRRCVIL